MADRMHSYPMFPQNLAPNPLQQSQIPQQPPQSQQPDPQMISALSNPEHSRMWQQMNLLQNPYRPHQSNDLTPPQINQQIQEFTRAQALSHGQGQSIVQQMQQPFGLTAQRMNPPGAVFHDPQANQPQPLIPSNFPNMPINPQPQMKAAFNMNPMMHAAMNPGVARSLKMLNQPDIPRLPQSGLGPQHAPNQPAGVDMFASPSTQPHQDQMNGSPHPASQVVGPPGTSQGMVPANQRSGFQKRMMTPAEFQERRLYLLGLITETEDNLKNLMQAARSGNVTDLQVQQKLNLFRGELASRREVYAKFLATFGAIVSQQMANGIPTSNMPHIAMAHSTSQQSQQVAVSNNQVQPGFVSQVNQPAPYLPSNNGSSPLPTQSQGALSQQIPMQPTQIGRTIPPRTGNTPQQIAGGQLPTTMSPNMGSFTTQAGQKIPNLTRQPAGIMPLDRQRFESTYSLFCRAQNIDLAGLHVPIGDKTVDLHQLHSHVIREGGGKSVSRQDKWAVIGGRLGIIQFPGNNNEPDRCGPVIAQQLHNTYDSYLQHFEDAYLVTVRNRAGAGSPQQPQQQQSHQMNPGSLAMGNNATTPGVPGNSTEMQQNPSRSAFNQQQIVATAVRYALSSAQEMRAQRVPEHLINFVERYRSELMRIYQQRVQMVKQSAEQGQQNMGNAQGQSSNIQEQASIGLPPGVQRPQANMPPGDTKLANGSLVPDNIANALKQPPTQEQVQQARMAINQLRNVFQQRSLPGMPSLPIVDEQRLEYNQILEQVFKMTSELEGKLHMYLVVFKNEELIRKYVAIVMTVEKQRQLVAASPPQYIINLPTLRNMQGQIQKLNEEFGNRWHAMRTSVAAAAVAANSQNQPSAPLASTRINHTPSLPLVQNISQSVLPVPHNNGRQVSINPPPSVQAQSPLPPQQLPSQAPSQPNPSQQPSQQPTKKPFRPSVPPSPSVSSVPATLASPTPPPLAASSSTPATSAPTPQTIAGSPQTPKSPASKAAGKAKSTPRVSRKHSTAGKGSATPEMVPSVIGIKRSPEEDVASLINAAPLEPEASNAPSPKKIKTEWEGDPSEALVKKQHEVENTKTEEDATAFFDRMKELFAMTASTDNEINHDIASTLGQILAGVAQEPTDATATATALSVHGAGDAGPPPTALSPHLGPANDAFLEFIDFSSFTTLEDEDNNSKAPTPDLVPSSEANPSPESGSEGDLLGNTGSPDKTKIEESGDHTDPLRLGSLREIDAGESSYYQGDSWKWEGSMHTIDQPWAISHS